MWSSRITSYYVHWFCFPPAYPICRLLRVTGRGEGVQVGEWGGEMHGGGGPVAIQLAFFLPPISSGVHRQQHATCNWLSFCPPVSSGAHTGHSDNAALSPAAPARFPYPPACAGYCWRSPATRNMQLALFAPASRFCRLLLASCIMHHASYTVSHTHASCISMQHAAPKNRRADSCMQATGVENTGTKREGGRTGQKKATHPPFSHLLPPLLSQLLSQLLSPHTPSIHPPTHQPTRPPRHPPTHPPTRPDT